MDMEKVGDRLYKERILRRITMREIERLSGIDKSTISRIEHGKGAHFNSVVQIAKALGLTLADLEEDDG